MLLSFFKNRKRRKLLKELRSAVRHTLAADDDILPEKTKAELNQLKTELDAVRLPETDSKTLEGFDRRLERILPRNGFAHSMRGFLDVLVVACAVAGGIRALYIQPFKIPTSSMQPTLFGIHYIDRKLSEPHLGPVTRAAMPIQAERAKLTVQEDGWLSYDYKHKNKYFFFTESIFNIGNRTYTLPGDLLQNIKRYLTKTGDYYEKGETFSDGWLSTGDHLFVERFSIHFRDIKRGDIVVFTTEGLSSAVQPLGGFYYVKRLAGLPGDTLKIENNILMIRPKGSEVFKPAYELSEKFRKLYSFKGGYQGHKADGLLAPGQEITVPENHYFVLGDNTNHSLDARMIGFIPRKNIVGLAVNVFWPGSRRWGLVDRLPPLDTPTVLPSDPRYQPSAMSMQ